MAEKQTESQTDAQKPTFETALERLQQAVKRLESGELNLEESLKLFEEGVQLTRYCQEHLSAAEQRVDLLTRVSAEDGGKAEFQPFSPGSR